MAMSVSASMDAVASSSTSTRGRRKSARAMHRHWRCPTEKLSPFSVTGASNPPSCGGHRVMGTESYMALHQNPKKQLINTTSGK
eukprot:1131099-Prorocentrum_minimum.AAC.1